MSDEHRERPNDPATRRPPAAGGPPMGRRGQSKLLIALAAIAALVAIIGFLVVGDRTFVDTTGTLPQEIGPQEEPDVVVPPTPATPAPSPLPSTPAQPPQPVQ